MPLRIGLLSTARINGAVIDSDTDRVHVVAVASRDAPRAREYALEHALPRAYGSYEELLADDEVDAVYVPLPNSLHVPWTLRALAAGKHVLCEKPLTRRPEEAESVFDAAARAGLVVMEAFMYRHLPQTRRIEELVDGGAIGRMRSIDTAFTFKLDRPEDVRLRPELDGGALMDVGCYCVNVARFLAGEPQSAFGVQDVGDVGVDLTFHGTLRFDDDVVAQFRSSFELPAWQHLEVVGDEATLLVEAPFRSDWGGDLLLRRGNDVERVPIGRVNAFRAELENFADAVEGQAAPLLGRDDAVGQARTIDALYRSADEGREVRL